MPPDPSPHPFKSRWAIIGYLFFLFDSRLWRTIARLGDIDFIVSIAGRLRPYMQPVWGVVSEYGWLLGVAWLTFLWWHSRKPKHAVASPTRGETILEAEPTNRPYPTVMVFRHDEARQRDQITFHQVTDRFAQAGWRVEGATTNLPQHARGIRIKGGTSFEREMAKWGLDGLGVEWQYDDTGDPPAALQIIVGVYEQAVQRGNEQASPTPIRVLERFYMALVQLQGNLDRTLWLDRETGKDSDLYPMESALEKIRVELMNLSPAVFPTAMALDFQKRPASESGYVEPKVRLPKAIAELMKAVERHWHRLAEKVGVTPLRWKDDPIVKLQDR